MPCAAFIVIPNVVPLPFKVLEPCITFLPTLSALKCQTSADSGKHHIVPSRSREATHQGRSLANESCQQVCRGWCARERCEKGVDGRSNRRAKQNVHRVKTRLCLQRICTCTHMSPHARTCQNLNLVFCIAAAIPCMQNLSY